MEPNDKLEPWERWYKKFFFALVATVVVTIISVYLVRAIRGDTLGSDLQSLGPWLATAVTLYLLLRWAGRFSRVRTLRDKLNDWRQRSAVHDFAFNFVLYALCYITPALLRHKSILDGLGIAMITALLTTLLNRASFNGDAEDKT